MLILLGMIGVNLAKYTSIGIITTNEIITIVIYTPVAIILSYACLFALKVLMPDSISRKLNCAKKGPIDLSGRNMSAFAIETAIQNGVVG